MMYMSRERKGDRDKIKSPGYSELPQYREKFAGYYIPEKYLKKFNQTLTPRQRRKKEAGEILSQMVLGKFKTPRELRNFKPQDNDWILRTADGNGELIAFDGDKLNKDSINSIKTAYKTDQGISYLDARPITYKEWKELPPQFQMASRRDRE